MRRYFSVTVVMLGLACGTFVLAASPPASSPVANSNGNESDLLAAGHAHFSQGDFARARAAYEKILARPEAPVVFHSLAMLNIAQTFEREGDLAGAKAGYALLTKTGDVPAHHQWEAEERLRELNRRENGLPPRDPTASRLKLPPPPKPAVTFHVAPNGAEKNSGAAGEPFRTLEQARDAIRELKSRGPLPLGGATVLVHGGEYTVSQTFTLDARDSGTEQAPVIYQAATGSRPHFRGGIRLTDFKLVSDPATLERLPAEARGKVLEADLKAAGVRELIPLKLGGFAGGHGFKTHPAHELFFDGTALPRARGPNEGFMRIKDVAVKDGTKGYDREGSKVGEFFYEGNRPARWGNDPNMLLYGYWFWDWADSYERVRSIDLERRVITLEEPLHRYGFSIGAPFYAWNALSELDQPGEWYFDHANGRVLFYPPSDPAGAIVEFSILSETMVRMENVSHVGWRGITWELGSADAIQIRGGTNSLIAGCVVRRFAGNGIEIQGGEQNGVLSCDIYSMGRGGVIVSGGNRKTLAPGGHFVENCHIYELSRIDHTYTPAIIMSGVGNRAAHNRLHDIQSSAMRVGGNEHLIEFNEVFNVVLESDDQGGADMFGNATYRGNVYRYNYWHHIGRWDGTNEQQKHGQAGIRLDDAISGTLIYGNIFYRSSGGKLGFGGVQIHGGKDNIIDNNLFVECAAMVTFSGWSDSRWLGFVKTALEDKAIDKEVYLERYPALRQLHENANANHLWRNVGLKCGDLIRRDPRRSHLVDNFLDVGGELNFDAEQGFVNRPGFAPIPFQEIGLYQDEFRRDIPPMQPPRISPGNTPLPLN